MDKNEIKDGGRRILHPVVKTMASLGVTPLLVSTLGLLFSLYGAYVLWDGRLFASGVWLLVAGVCDVLDGSLARFAGTESKFGAFIDSTFDRISELAYLCALMVYFAVGPHGYNGFLLGVTSVVLIGSILTSYARARLEGIGYECHVGLLERPERLTLLVAGLLFGHRLLIAAMVLLAVGTSITVVQRIHHAYKVTRG